MLAAYAPHRHRFAAEVAGLDDDALAQRSRCSEWSVADVLRHGCDVDQWMHVIWAGEPLPFTTFDPRTTPNEWVIAHRSIPDPEVRDRYVASAEGMAVEVGDSPRERWSLPSLSPLGFVPWWLSALHIFWDSLVHERDALLPLGVEVPVVHDETLPALAYCLAIVGTFIHEPTDAVVAGVRLTVGEGPVISEPEAATADTDTDVATIIDALSGRTSLEDALPECDPQLLDRLGALTRMFHS